MPRPNEYFQPIWRVYAQPVSFCLRALDHTATRPWLIEDQNRAARFLSAAAAAFYKRERDGHDEPGGIHRAVG